MDLFGLITLADLSAVAERTVLAGSAGLADALVLCPGFHRQQDAPNLSGGDYPWCAAMTTGYVFRIENEATICYMQKVGRPGRLTSLVVLPTKSKRSSIAELFELNGTSRVSTLTYVAAIILSILAMTLLYIFRDMFGLLFLVVLVFARLANVVVIRRRAVEGWKGQPEPGAKSDLIVLLSQDRWIRLKGAVDDVKAVTSGQWLEEPTLIESACVALATLMVYSDVALAANASQAGKVVLIILLFSSAGLLGLANEYTRNLQMYGRTVTPTGPPRSYKRRLELTEELVKETGRGDWAIGLGMANQDDVERFLSNNGSNTGLPDDDKESVRKTRASRQAKMSD